MTQARVHAGPTHTIIPLPAGYIGTIFVVSLVMGDFVTVQAMSGGQSASVGVAMNHKRALLVYPAAAASDNTSDGCSGYGCHADADHQYPQGTLRSCREAPSPAYFVMSVIFGLFVLFLYGPMIAIIVLSFQGPDGGLTFPINGFSFHWFSELFKEQRVGDFKGSFLRFHLYGNDCHDPYGYLLSAGLAYRKPFRCRYYLLHYCRQPYRAFDPDNARHRFNVRQARSDAGWYTSGMGAHLTWTLPRPIDHV